jgi:hypothetical protein
MVLQRKSIARTMNPRRSSGDERAIANTQLKPARTDNTVFWLSIDQCGRRIERNPQRKELELAWPLVEMQ